MLALAAAAGGWLAKPATPAPLVRLSIAMPPGEQVTTYPAISSDGRTIAYAAGHTAATSQLYLRTLDDFVGHPVANSGGAEYPFFSPDGRSIAFFAGGKLRRASVAGGAGVNVASAPTPWGGTWDAQGHIIYTTLTPLLSRPFAQHVQGVAPDGSIVYIERQPVTGSDLWTLSPDGRTMPLVVTPFNEDGASISPDGRYVAYVSDESGHREVFAIPASGRGARVAISIGGGTGPMWSRDGRELFYRAGDTLVSVQVQTREALVLGERKTLLDLSAYDAGYFHDFEVSADGQRFLLIRTEPESRPNRLDVILNWFDELRRKVG